MSTCSKYVSSTQETLETLSEVAHEINSPLAVIRNAIYLVSKRVQDPQTLQYLTIADEEVEAISHALRRTRNRLLIEAEPEPPIPFPSASQRVTGPHGAMKIQAAGSLTPIFPVPSL
jgi:signal transduction histidine kinase